MTDSQGSAKPEASSAPVGEKLPAPKTDETPVPIAEKSTTPAKPGKGSRWGAIIVLLLIVASLTWYFVADRLTPYTSQARVQAFVVPVPAEVSGTVLKVYV